MNFMYNWDSIIGFGKHKFMKIKDADPHYLLQLCPSVRRTHPLLSDFLTSVHDELKEKAFRQDSDKLPKPIQFEPIVNLKCTKETFASEADAKYRLRHIKAKEQDHKKPYRVYECPICSGWHLTSQENREYAKKQNQ